MWITDWGSTSAGSEPEAISYTWRTVAGDLVCRAIVSKCRRSGDEGRPGGQCETPPLPIILKQKREGMSCKHFPSFCLSMAPWSWWWWLVDEEGLPVGHENCGQAHSMFSLNSESYFVVVLSFPSSFISAVDLPLFSSGHHACGWVTGLKWCRRGRKELLLL